MQGDVHRNTGPSREHTPFLLDVQTDLLDGLDTRLVVPLVLASAFGRRAARLHPAFVVDGREVVMATHLMAAIRRAGLGEVVASLAGRRDEVLGAIDVLLTGV
jgi:toxin CcdB